MKIPERMEQLYRRLEAFGIDQQYVRSIVMPAGWRDSETENPAVYSQALGLLAQNLNLNLRSLQNDAAPLEWQDCGPTRFKRSRALSDDELVTAKCIAVRAAQIACQTTTSPPAMLPESGAAIRNAILRKGNPYVGFEALLDHCWESGIPVLHVARFPANTHKPDALAVIFEGRPAIVIMKWHKYPAWLLFIMAHELGHIAKNHLNGEGVLVDDKVDRDASEDIEAEANTFAAELLTGKPDIRYQASYNLTAQQLVEAAQKTSQRDGVDPGFVALNYANSKGHYAVGNLALHQIEPNADPVAAIHSRMTEQLDWEGIGRDSRQFLRHITEMKAR